jgi:hypothetical protein
LNREFLRREWGAVSFLIVTALGIVVVPIGLNLNKQSTPTAGTTLVTAASPSPAISAGPTVSPAASIAPSAAASASPSAGASPSASSSGAAPSPSPS